jgi:predicted nuclease with TOPRIM domain
MDEIKSLFEAQASTFEALKKTVNELEAQVKKSGEDVVTKDKNDRVNSAIDKLTDEIKAAKSRQDELEAKANRLALAGNGADDVETK